MGSECGSGFEAGGNKNLKERILSGSSILHHNRKFFEDAGYNNVEYPSFMGACHVR